MKKRIIALVVLMLLFASLAFAAEQCPNCTSYNTGTGYTNHYHYDTCPYTSGCTITMYCRWDYKVCNVCHHTWDDEHTILDTYHTDPECPYH